LFEHYRPLEYSPFTPRCLMEPRTETIPINERFERLQKINEEIARSCHEFKWKVFMEAGEQWKEE